MTTYSIKIGDIEKALAELGGQATYAEIQEKILTTHCEGKTPQNYKDASTFSATIRRKVEDYCPESKDFNAAKNEVRFRRVGRGTYRLASMDVEQKIDLDSQKSLFEARVEKAKSDSSAARLRRLTRAPKRPIRIKVTMEIFLRNADVVAEVLHRANGACERCKNPAPFLRKKDGSPYLEVHHVQQLANDGEDTVDNAIALCPNCHREMHFGTV